MKEKLSYKPFGRFVMRTPLFPLGEVSAKARLDSDLFREAIFLASPELHAASRSTDDKQQQKVEASLLKYHHRASTRCTPFGLFAGCSVGNVGAETAIELLPAEHNRRTTRLDMQYLCALIQHIECLPQVRSQLLFYPNDSLYPMGESYRYVAYRYKKSARIHTVVSLRIDEPLTRLLERASEGATVDQLAALFADEAIPYEEVVAYLDEVIDSQVLKSELDPCVVGGDVFDVLIAKLSSLKAADIVSPLRQIRSLLDTIDSRPAGTTQPLYGEIIRIVASIGVAFEAKYLFQTDLYKPVERAVVAQEIPHRILRLIHFLAKITPPQKQGNLSNFVAAFEARYESEEIPLAVALDRELGLSYPVSAKGGNDLCPLIDELAFPGTRDPGSLPLRPVDEVLLRKYTECIRTHSTVVELTDDDFKHVSYTHELPDTMSVLCSLPGDGVINVVHVGSTSGTSLLGRFVHLSPEVYQLVKGVADTEQALQEGKLVAEIAHLPESRIGNIASRLPFRDYTLHYLSNYEPTQEAIDIADLLVSVKQGRVVLRSKKYNKEVVPRLSCAHNYAGSYIPVYRFLCDLQNQGLTPGFHCSWNQLFRTLDYLPRISYNNILLARQQWVVKEEETAGFDPLSDAALLAATAGWMKRRGLPPEVVIPDSDNELYLDLRLAESVRLLLSYVNRRKRLVLEEFLFHEQDAVVRQGGAGFAHELIFLFHK